MPEETIACRVYGDPDQPTLVYLPGLHGDWTLITSFRIAVANRIRFVELTYPRTLTWTIDDYARAVDRVLAEQGIRTGWLLGESFGSQVGWGMLDLARRDASAFQPQGYVLANGFDRYPFIPGVFFVRWVMASMPAWMARAFMWIYRKYAFFRHRKAPETFSSMTEFFERRNRADVEAMRHRLWLIAQYDPRPAIREVKTPVYFLAGVIDPIVPWVWCRRWIRKNCPGFRGQHTILRADHNVLRTQPGQSAEKILAWMKAHAIRSKTP